MDTLGAVRVLNACPKCDRQYDVSHLDVGRKVRCECGELFDVRIEKPRDPRVLKCAHCGGLLREGARACEYCSAEITLEERRLSAVCPKCFARAATDASYCMECGVKLDPQALYALADGTVCPRCKGALRSRALGGASVIECSGCGGLWLSMHEFARLCEQAEAERAPNLEIAPSASARIALSPEAVRYMPCPACGAWMSRKNYATSSGVIIDLCAAHGVWLDESELHTILSFIRAGGLERSRQREVERRREEERRAQLDKVVREVQWASRMRGTVFDRRRGDPAHWIYWILDAL
jgi:Zn-finger nucleic acid-binding protein/ribosomal protein L40E